MAAPRVVVAGALASKPGNGGEAWVRLSWVRGLLRLGFDVRFIEELSPVPPTDEAFDRALGWFTATVARFGIADRSILVGDDVLAGADGMAEVENVLRESDLLVNISGNLRRGDLLGLCRRSAYVDLDPGFTQVWAATGVADLGLGNHDLHFTVGERIGTSRCPLPTAGFRWLPCRQPVLLDDFAVSPCPPAAALSTVATWRCSFGPVDWDGAHYGLKVHEFRKVVDLPRHVDIPMELALDLHPGDNADERLLLDNGWRVRRASDVAGSPEQFRAYIERSAGEFSVAQGIYAHGRTGWFSDRTARYLAAGRPVIVQDTSLADDLPVGEGLLVFTDRDGAAAAINRVADDHASHAAAARTIAETYFDADVVVKDFMTNALNEKASARSVGSLSADAVVR